MENRYVATIATRGTSSDWVYIGAMYPSSNAFAWIDGSVWSYNNIDPFHTPRSGYSATIGNSKRSNNGFWTSVPFNWAHSFICKRPAETQCPPNQPTVTITSVPNQPSYCNSSLILAPGVITSPNYPQNYDINLFCSYQLATLGSYKILLQFTGFITESNDDIVNVYDEKKPLLGSYSGNLGSFNLVSTGNTVYVTFKTDGSNVYQGFSARFFAVSGS